MSASIGQRMKISPNSLLRIIVPHFRTPSTEPVPPQYLYRYLSINSKYHQRIITKSSLYLSSVQQLNDPFEGRIYPLLNYSKQQMLEIVCRQAAKLRSAGQFAAAEKMRTEGIRNVEIAFQSESTKTQLFESMISGAHSNPDFPVNRTGVVCFSETNDNILMWSHYSDSHRGYCIQIEPLSDEKIWKSLYKVSYADEYPRFVFESSSDHTAWREMIATKSVHWRYEREWRLLGTDLVGKEIRYAPALLTGVIFGCLTADEDKRKIRHWASGLSLRYFEAKRKAREFGLDIVPIE